MGVIRGLVRVVKGNDWNWLWVYTVYHSDNDGGGRDHVDTIGDITHLGL